MKSHLQGRGIFGVSMLSAFLVTFGYPHGEILVEQGSLTVGEGDNVMPWQCRGGWPADFGDHRRRDV